MTKEELKTKYEEKMGEYRHTEIEKEILEDEYDALMELINGSTLDASAKPTDYAKRKDYLYLLVLLLENVCLGLVGLKIFVSDILSGYFNIGNAVVITISAILFAANVPEVKNLYSKLKKPKNTKSVEIDAGSSLKNEQNLTEIKAKLTEVYAKCDQLLREANDYNRAYTRTLESETEGLPSIGNVREREEIRRRTL